MAAAQPLPVVLVVGDVVVAFTDDGTPPGDDGPQLTIPLQLVIADLVTAHCQVGARAWPPPTMLVFIVGPRRHLWFAQYRPPVTALAGGALGELALSGPRIEAAMRAVSDAHAQLRAGDPPHIGAYHIRPPGPGAVCPAIDAQAAVHIAFAALGFFHAVGVPRPR